MILILAAIENSHLNRPHKVRFFISLIEVVETIRLTKVKPSKIKESKISEEISRTNANLNQNQRVKHFKSNRNKNGSY